MKFARVQGHGSLSDDARSILLVVALDFGARSEIVREETVAWLAFGPPGDVQWQIDQYTQETIGSILAEDGWEAISEDTRVAGIDDGLYHSPSYVVRQMGSSTGDL
jgi:hypothetical protein